MEEIVVNLVCEENKCVACGACFSVCPVNAITLVNSIRNYNACINPDKCIDCHACEDVCQKKQGIEASHPIKWFQGWVEEENIRKKAASGGVAGAIATSFIKVGGYVCSCVFQEGKFGFKITNNVEDVACFAGSKYVKSELDDVYVSIKDILKRHKKVLFIGLPCQVAGIKKFIGTELSKYLYTVDLICHGTPSGLLFEVFLKEHGYSLADIKKITFRQRNRFLIRINSKSLLDHEERDKYSIAFLKGLSYTDNCYECDYARIERVADLTLGDSWGSMLEKIEREKGISLILCQNEKGEELLGYTKIRLFEVDLDNAVAANHQLKYPAIAPKTRNKFFELLDSNCNFDAAVARCLPWDCIKQKIKKMIGI